MDTLIIENIRCFGSRQEVPIKPLTLLVGENSTGKTTFLAVFKIACGLGGFMPYRSFNEEPFRLGGFDQIVRSKRSRKKPITFIIGYEANSKFEYISDIPVRYEAVFGNSESEPFILSWTISHNPFRIVAVQETHDTWTVHVAFPGGDVSIQLCSGEGYYNWTLTPGGLGLSPLGARAVLPAFLAGQLAPERHEERERIRPHLGMLLEMVDEVTRFSDLGREPRAIGAIRSKPIRTYDPLGSNPDPDGGHVLFRLSRIHSLSEDAWTGILRNLLDLGRKSGLFDSLEIKRLGRTGYDPFQIELNVAGPRVNLVDVGYGVSQVLPILAEALMGGDRQTLLLQQPEVHLHPRAQAELGTFFGTMVRDHGKRFLIETHSDHLIDRVRMDVRDGKSVGPDDVIILYFERQGGEVIIHPLKIDGSGNLLDAPPGYRDFFLREESRFLGVD